MRPTRAEVWIGRTGDAPHVRDRVTVRGVGRGFALALLPCVLVALHEAGGRALPAVAGAPGAGDLAGVTERLARGAAQLAPVLLASAAACALWAGLFAVLRRRSPSSGLLATALILTLAVPASAPSWQVAVATSFGVVLALEVFGGTGMNVAHPALVAWAFLSLAYPGTMRGDVAATPALAGGPAWVIACALGAAWLLARRLASGRVLTGGVVGWAVATAVAGLLRAGDPAAALPEAWLPSAGAFAFGLVFVATDPATSAETDRGRWAYGALVGLLTVLFRLTTPAGAGAVFSAILLAELAAPALDQAVVFVGVRRRRRRRRARHA